ncbi:peptidoglycan -binding protein [Siccirubricoccus deserti]
MAEALRRAEAAGGDAAQTVRRLTETGRNLAAERAARAQAEAQLAESRGAVETSRRELEGVNRLLAEAQARLTETQRQLAAMRAEVAALDRQVQADRATIEARLSDIARLSEQIRALSAMRDQMERQAAEAARRAGDEAQRRSTAEAAASTEAERRAAAERAVGEQTRLAESARAQVALLTRQIEELRAQISRVAAALDIAEASGRDKDAQISALGTRLNAALAARVEELQRYRSDFFGRLRDVLGDRPEVRIVGDRFVFQSEVLFPPGSADLSAAGQSQIREIARVLQELSARIPRDVNWLLRVDGHADRIPIRSARFASNWELSAARAIAVAQLLMAEGLPPNRVAATAFGDNQPLDSGDSPEALARNRRIELRLTDR